MTANQVVPEGWGEREEKPRSQRWPKKLTARIERIAKETDQDFTEVLFLGMRWVCEEYEARRKKERDAAAAELKR